jgi:hypothetical protein
MAVKKEMAKATRGGSHQDTFATVPAGTIPINPMSLSSRTSYTTGISKGRRSPGILQILRP